MNKASHKISLTDGETEISCPEGVSVLVAMHRAGLSKIPVGCRAGGCGVCKVRVVSGQYHVGKMSRAHVSEADEAAGVVLACKVFPEGDLLIDPQGKFYKSQ